MRYKIDIKRIIDEHIHLQGWVLPNNPEEKVEYEVFNSKSEKIDIKLVSMKRQDVEGIYLGGDREGLNLGFDITFPYKEGEVYTFNIITNEKKIRDILHKDSIDKFNSYKYKKWENFIAYFNPTTIKRALEFLMQEGPVAFIKKTNRKVKDLDSDYGYNEWFNLTKTNNDELERQRKEYKNDFRILPFFSIVIPVYDTSDKFLRLLFDSILSQTYQEFEICVADATEYDKKNNKNNPRKFFEKLEKELDEKGLNNKLKIKYLAENKSISDNTNEAINIASGDYIVLCDHDDELTLDALYENAKAINANKDIKMIYSDEDKVDMKDQSYFEPNFKSDFNLDMLLSVNYICHLTVVKKETLDDIRVAGQYLRPEYNGAQDYDLFLRIVNYLYNEEDGERNIYHIPKVLYHWRCHDNSTSKNVDSKDYAFENGKKAIKDFYNHTKINFRTVERVEDGFDKGIYHTVFKPFDSKFAASNDNNMSNDVSNYEPKVTIVIPNKDHIEDLEKAISSVACGTYKNIEFLVVENNSTDEKTFEYYKELESRDNIKAKVICYKGEFNFSKINNFAVDNITLDKDENDRYILFLNNDVEMINKDSITELVNYISRDDVGIVGAKLLYNDDTIQHAGVVIGFGGIAGHTFIGKHDKDHTYANRSQIIQDYSAVTAACMMIKKSLFDKINGFDEKLVVAFNDIDICMKVRAEKKLVVYNPYCSFYHYESKSRGLEDTKEKVDRFNKEVAYFAVKWHKEMENIDQYYNPNLTLRKSDFSLRNLNYEKVGEAYELPKEIKNLMNNIK